MGHLVPARVFGAPAPDLAGVKTSGGDYVVEQLARRVDQPKLVADIVSTWMRHGENRQSIYYATSVAHSVHIRDEFVNAGITAEHIDGGTPLDEREDSLRRFATKEVRILCNCATFFEGWDCPGVSLVGLARPTKSYGLLCQMVGRGRRPTDGKRDMVILDHAGSYPAHGMPDDHVEWTLDPDKLAHRNKSAAKRQQSGSRISECSQCGALRTGGQPCPNCGFLPRPKPEIVISREGELVELKARKEAATAERERQREWYGMLLGYAEMRGHKRGFAYHKHIEKFGKAPPVGYVKPMPPSDEVLAWIRSRQIAWARSRHP